MYINSLAFPFIKAKKEKLYILYLCLEASIWYFKDREACFLYIVLKEREQVQTSNAEGRPVNNPPFK